MLHKETVTAGTLDLIHRLMGDAHLQQFYLVGGTALALMLGHRISIDIDLFTDEEFDTAQMMKHLSANYGTELNSTGKNSISGFLEGIKFDLIAHRYPYVKPVINLESIRMLSLHDIAAMKVNAIVGNGTRVKDFLDVHFLLKIITYEEMINAYLKKYPDVSANMARSSLLYHKDIDFTVPVTMIKDGLKWKEVDRSIRSAIAVYEKQEARKFIDKKRESGQDRDNDLDQGLSL